MKKIMFLLVVFFALFTNSTYAYFYNSQSLEKSSSSDGWDFFSSTVYFKASSIAPPFAPTIIYFTADAYASGGATAICESYCLTESFGAGTGAYSYSQGYDSDQYSFYIGDDRDFESLIEIRLSEAPGGGGYAWGYGTIDW